MADASLGNDVLSGQDSLAVSELNPFNGVLIRLANATVVSEVVLDSDLVIGAVLKADDQVVLIDIARVLELTFGGQTGWINIRSVGLMPAPKRMVSRLPSVES